MNRAFNNLHSHIVINTRTGRWVQGEYSQASAERAVKTLNDHEERNSRLPIYDHFEITTEEHQDKLKVLAR